MATLESVFPPALGMDTLEYRKINTTLTEITNSSTQETFEGRVAATIRSDVNTFLVDLFNKLDCKTPPTKADVELQLFQIVESAVRRRRNDCVPFNHLPIDVIHCVFAELLDLDRIYDHTFPISAIETHRKNLFKMRSVSTAWNDFLVSSPRYWPAINIGNQPTFVKLAITRAQDTPLILYSGLEARFEGSRATVVREILEGNYASQVAAIRIDGTGDAYVFRSFLEKGMAHIKTLEVPSTMWPGGHEESPLSARLWLSAQLPRLRNLVAKGWEPPAGAHWLTDLQTLSIRDKRSFGANTLRALSTCINLRKLELQSQDSSPHLPEDEYSDVPAHIMLPNLRQLLIESGVNPFLGQIARRLIVPPETPSLLRIDSLPAPQPNGALVEDLAHFIRPCVGVQKVAKDMITEIGWGWVPPQSWFTYKAGCRSIALPRPQPGDQEDRVVNAIASLQAVLHDPPMTVVAIDHKENDTFLGKVADLKIKRILIKGSQTNLERALASIGSRRPNLPTGTITDTDWPFESLKELVVEDITLSIRQLIRIVGMRQPYLRSTSKTWLERISLVNCKFTGMTVGQAANQFAKLGVVLVDSGCERAPRLKQK